MALSFERNNLCLKRVPETAGGKLRGRTEAGRGRTKLLKNGKQVYKSHEMCKFANLNNKLEIIA